MPNRIHSFIFLLFLILFVTVAPLALLYSEGYRYNFDDNEIVKTGGLSLKVAPQIRAEVYLDGEFQEKVSGWNYSTYINGLPAKNYDVQVSKEGFHPWEKTLKIQESKVAEAKNILMVPTEPELQKQIKETDSFTFSPDETKMAYRNDNELGIYDIEEATTTARYSTTTFTKWGPKSEKFLINATDSHLVVEDQETTEIELPTTTKEIHFNPNNTEELFYSTQDELLKVDYTEDSPQPTTTISDYLDFDLTSQGIRWLSETGRFHQGDFSGSIETTFSLSSLPLEAEDYEIISRGIKPLILADEDLYVLTEDEKLKQLDSNVKEVEVSPFSQKVALISEHEVNVVYLKEQEDQPRKKKYEKDFITGFSQPIEKVSWLDPEHLILNLNDTNKIKISEIDTRSQVNMVDYLNTDFDRWYWNNNRGTLYLLNENTLYKNSFLD